MNKKLILFVLAVTLLKLSIIHPMQSNSEIIDLPTKQEVFATSNPLTITFYALHLSYLNERSIPQGGTFEERLYHHKLLASQWLDEKGFMGALQVQHQNGASLEDVKKAIEANPVYQNFGKSNMFVTQKVIKANLLQAYKDCSVIVDKN